MIEIVSFKRWLLINLHMTFVENFIFQNKVDAYESIFGKLKKIEQYTYYCYYIMYDGFSYTLLCIQFH